VRKADNLPPSCADVKKSGCLNLLESCGPVQACNGTALPSPLPLVCHLVAQLGHINSETAVCQVLVG
jgi:hypothetical protein